MIDKIKSEITKLETEYNNAIKALNIVQEQIQVYKKKGEELTAHLNYVKGAIDILKEVSKEDDNND